MSRVAGWISFRTNPNERPGIIEAMTAAFGHGGPDEVGTWAQGRAALACTGLADTGNRGTGTPMAIQIANHTVAIVHSGEIYNEGELRRVLADQGHSFTTDRDAEVILRGYLQWGEQVADRLNGMFAIAIWDERSARLVLIRDRVGAESLCYYSSADGVIFGSEPKAILAHPAVRSAVDTDSLRQVFVFAKTRGRTVWKDIHEVEQGSIVTVNGYSRSLRRREYWRLTAAPHTDDQTSTLRRVRELLDDVARRQVIDGGTPHILLSGGLDSSTLTGLAAAGVAKRHGKVRTFSVIADELGYTDDTPYIREVVQLAGSEHTDLVFGPEQLSSPDLRRAVIRARDMPNSWGDADSSLYLTFKAIRGMSTTALSGDTADAVFGFHPAQQKALIHAGTFPGTPTELVDGWSSPLRPDVRRALELERYTADMYSSAIAQVEYLEQEKELDRHTRTIANLEFYWSMRAILERREKISNAAGLNVRVPYSDHRLVEYVYNVPWSLKTFDGREKSLLRHAAMDVVPPSVSWRPKGVYPFINDHRYTVALQLQAKDMLNDADNPAFAVISRDWVQAAVEREIAPTERGVRFGLDRALDLYHWFDMYNPGLYV